MFNIWENDYSLVKEIYGKDNYSIEYDENKTENLCVIYFSSNNIWFPNTKEAFVYSFVEKDYYEWKRYKNIKAKKSIFVRDIFKSWYVTGINERIDSIDKLLEFLKEETRGMKIVTVGSSAGGYIATLMGAMLKATYVLCFSAQFSLNTEKILNANPFVQKYRNDKECYKWYEIYDTIKKSNVDIYYMMPIFVKEDYEQMKQIEDIDNVHIMKILSKHHGIPILKCNLPKLLMMDKSSLNKLFLKKSNKKVNPILFSLEISGLFDTIKCIMREIKNLLNKKKKLNKGDKR